MNEHTDAPGQARRPEPPDEAPEVRWQYRTITVTRDNPTVLMQAGQDGWEAYGVRATDDGEMYFLKKAKPGQALRR
jgi:hypothetical protein